MNNTLFAHLKRECAQFLLANGHNPKRGMTKTSAKMIHIFWYGAICALGAHDDARVTLLLLSGRHNELCDFTPEPPETTETTETTKEI